MKDSVKVIALDSEPSSLVGMYALLVEDDKIHALVFISGKADHRYFICQVISLLDGQPNIAKLLTLDELTYWYIVPSVKLVDEILADYKKNGWRYSAPFTNSNG